MQQYIVRRNDTLFLIARRFGIPLSLLIQANPQLENPNQLQIGDVINIPALEPVPGQLTDMENLALTMMDDVYQGNWAAAQVKLNQIKTAMSEVEPILRAATVPQGSITGLTQVINRLQHYLQTRQVYPSLAQANLITGYLPDILDHFATPVPTDFWRLYYLARAIVINIENNDWPEAGNNYQRTKAVWERLRAQTPAAYRSQVMAFNELMENLEQSIMNRNYLQSIEGANSVLTEGKALEDVFLHRNLNTSF